MHAIKRRLTDLSLELAEDVKTLRVLVNDAWKACIMEYFQVVTMRLVDPQYSHEYFTSSLHDSIEFQKFSQELNDNKEFRNRQIWRAWTYIRPLVVKYINENKDGRIGHLDKGRRHSVWHNLGLVFGRLPRAISERDRPDRYVTEQEWRQLSPRLINGLLDEVIVMCGYQEKRKGDWKYADVFATNPQRLISLLA